MGRLTHLLILLLLSLSLAVTSAASSAGGRTQYAPRVIPAVWQKVGSAPPNKPLTFDFIFAPRDAAGLEERMLEIAHSQSAWLSEGEIASYVAPSANVKAIVEAAITELGADSMKYSRNGGTLTVATTIGKASTFFNAKFVEYSHTQARGSYYKTHEYTIPPSIAAHISDISPFATFTHATRHGRLAYASPGQHAELHSRSLSTCNTSAVTAACIRSLYGFDAYTPTAPAGNSTVRLGIMGYAGENFNGADLQEYLKKYRYEASSYTIPVATIDGAINDDSVPGLEAALDTQTAAGIIYPLPSRFYDLGTDFLSGDIFLETFQHFLGLSLHERPSVITISYGSLEKYMTFSQASSMCAAAQQLTAAGMTIVASSGDNGVGGQSGESCPPFIPTYPSGCPYILSVGATQGFSPEVMTDMSLAGFYSGAGFSNYFATPCYQNYVVGSYEYELDSTNFNASGRAFPDISAQGSLQEVIVSGKVELASGTSASAPIVASGLTLLNELLMTEGKPTIGWANPIFYANPSAFTDVTSGGSYGCVSTTYGLQAKHGWDASAGLGTLSFPKLRAIYGV